VIPENNGEYMTNRWKFASVSFLLTIVALLIVPTARADKWDKKTVVTFSHAVEVPGQVLPPGTYVLKRVESDWDRSLVQIFTEDQSKLLATILTVPDYHVEPAGKTLLSFEERPSGSPEALASWFYPGDNYGVKFVYPKQVVQLASNSQPPASATQVTDEPAPVIAQTEHEPMVALPQPEAPMVAQNTAAQPQERVPASLPKTAGNFLALPLIGFALLFGGFTTLYKIRRGTERA
jgi:hypothetical protein